MPGPGGGKVVGVTLLTRGHIFYRDLEEGLLEEAAKNGYRLIVTSAEFDLGKQAAQIEDFVAGRRTRSSCVRGLEGSRPGDPQGQRRGDPRVHRGHRREKGTSRATWRRTTSRAANWPGVPREAPGRKGKVAIVDQPAITSVLDRVQGFKEAIAKHAGMAVVADVNDRGSGTAPSRPRPTSCRRIRTSTGSSGSTTTRRSARSMRAAARAGPGGDRRIRRHASGRGRDPQGDRAQGRRDSVPPKIGAVTVEMIRRHFAGETLQGGAGGGGIVDRAALDR